MPTVPFLLKMDINKESWTYWQQNDPAPVKEPVRSANKYAVMIVRDLHLINIVNGKSFQQLVGSLEPEYRLPSATHITHSIENKCKVVKQKVRNVINDEADYIAITADILYGLVWLLKAIS